MLFIFHNQQWSLVYWQHTQLGVDSSATHQGERFNQEQRIIAIPAPNASSSLQNSFLLRKFLYAISVQNPLTPQQTNNILNNLITSCYSELITLLENSGCDLRHITLLEWQTNRAKKLNGAARFNLILPNNNLEAVNSASATRNIAFGIDEKEPIRVIQDKPPIRLMTYETQFGPTKKSILQIPHVVLDNRRKYNIVIPFAIGQDAATHDLPPALVTYTLWEMSGPNRLEVQVYRSATMVIGRNLSRNPSIMLTTPPSWLPLIHTDPTHASHASIMPPATSVSAEEMKNAGLAFQHLQTLQNQPVENARGIEIIEIKNTTPPEVPLVAPANSRLVLQGLPVRHIFSRELIPTQAPTRALMAQLPDEKLESPLQPGLLRRRDHHEDEKKAPTSSLIQPKKLNVTESIEEHYALCESRDILSHLVECSQLLDVEKDHIETLMSWSEKDLTQERIALNHAMMKKEEDATPAAFKQFSELNLATQGVGLLSDLTQAGITSSYHQEQKIVTEESLIYKARYYHAFGQLLVGCVKRIGQPNDNIFSRPVSKLFCGARPEFLSIFKLIEERYNHATDRVVVLPSLYQQYDQHLEQISASFDVVKKEYDETTVLLNQQLKSYRELKLKMLRQKNVREFMIQDAAFSQVIPAKDLPEFIERLKLLNEKERKQAFQEFLKNTPQGQKLLTYQYYKDIDPLVLTPEYQTLSGSIFDFDNVFKDVSDPLIVLLMKEKILKYALGIIEIAQALKPLRAAMSSSTKLGDFFNSAELQKKPVTNNKIFYDLLLYPVELLSSIQINFLLSTAAALPDACFSNNQGHRKTDYLKTLEDLRTQKSKDTAIEHTPAALHTAAPVKLYCLNDFLVAAEVAKVNSTIRDDFFERLKLKPFAELTKIDLNILLSKLADLPAQCFIPGGKAECEKYIGFRADILMGTPFASSQKSTATSKTGFVNKFFNSITGFVSSIGNSAASASQSRIMTETTYNPSDSSSTIFPSSTTVGGTYDAVPATRGNNANISTSANTTSGDGDLSSSSSSIPMSTMGGGAYYAVPATRGNNANISTSANTTSGDGNLYSSSSSGPMTTMGGLQGLPSLTPAPEQKANNQPSSLFSDSSSNILSGTPVSHGFAVADALGIPALRCTITSCPFEEKNPEENAYTTLDKIKNALGYTDAISIDCVSQQNEGGVTQYACSLELKKNGQTLLSFKSKYFNSKIEAKNSVAYNDAAYKALLYLSRQPNFDKASLLIVPPVEDGNPTSTLLQFIQLHSIYKNGDELQGIYKSFVRPNNPSASQSNNLGHSLYECNLVFRNTSIAQGKGETKRRARENASREFLRILGMYYNKAITTQKITEEITAAITKECENVTPKMTPAQINERIERGVQERIRQYGEEITRDEINALTSRYGNDLLAHLCRERANPVVANQAVVQDRQSQAPSATAPTSASLIVPTSASATNQASFFGDNRTPAPTPTPAPRNPVVGTPIYQQTTPRPPGRS